MLDDYWGKQRITYAICLTYLRFSAIQSSFYNSPSRIAAPNTIFSFTNYEIMILCPNLKKTKHNTVLDKLI